MTASRATWGGSGEAVQVVLGAGPGGSHLEHSRGGRDALGRDDNAAAEAFFSSLEAEVLSRHRFENISEDHAVVLDWCYGFYNHDRRHSTIGMVSPIDYEQTAAPDRDAA